MNKNELCSGMMVEYRNGDRKIVLLDSPFGDILTSRDRRTFADLDDYNDDMEFNGDEQFDIVKVFMPIKKFRCLSADESDYEIIAEEDTAVDMTLDEVAAALGHKVRIV